MKFRFVLLSPDDDRAPLGKVDFSLFLTGQSGVFKTALPALCQQHFGGWTPQGARIGWVASSELFLGPATSYALAQELAGTQRIPLSEQAVVANEGGRSVMTGVRCHCRFVGSLVATHGVRERNSGLWLAQTRFGESLV